MDGDLRRDVMQLWTEPGLGERRGGGVMAGYRKGFSWASLEHHFGLSGREDGLLSGKSEEVVTR